MSEILSVGSSYVELHINGVPFTESIESEQRLVGKNYRTVAGGGAVYFSKACSSLGMETTFIGKRGTDAMGTLLEELLEESGVRTSEVVSDQVQTNTSVNLINPNGDTINVVSGSANQSLTGLEVLKEIEPLLDNARYLYFGGVFRLRSLIPSYEDLIREAHTHNVLVAMDHGPVSNDASDRDIAIIRKAIRDVDLYFPSKTEFLKAWSVKTIEDGLRKLADNSSALVVVKDREKGALVYENDQAVRIPAYPVTNIINPVGGGDSFNAGVIFAREQGLGPIDSARVGCATAALRITSTSDPSKVDVLNLFKS